MKNRIIILIFCCCSLNVSAQDPAADKELYKMTVEDGVFLPRKPLDDFINDAVQFIRDHDGNYVPGSMSEDAMPGYVEHCAFAPLTGKPIREFGSLPSKAKRITSGLASITDSGSTVVT